MGASMFNADKDQLPSFVNVEQWAFILNRFSEVLGIDIYTVDPKGKLITSPQRPPKIWKFLESAQSPSRLNFTKPSEMIQRLIQKSEGTRSSVEEGSTVGFTHCAIPIFTETGAPLAYLVVGPLVLGYRKSHSDLENLARDQGWDPLTLEGAYQELKLFSFVGMKAMLDLLSEVCHYLVKPTALKGEKGRILPDFFFSTLLDLALRATQADSGSIMVLDPSSQVLRIRASHGLKKEAILEVKLGLGEGIAGWVAQQNQSLLLDPDAEIEPLLRDRLSRHEIDSSIVMPISRQNQVLGVLSINSHDKKNRLSSQNLDLLAQLAKLTMVIF